MDNLLAPIVSLEERNRYIDLFYKKHVDNNKKSKNILIWNSFKIKPRCYSFEKIRSLGIKSEKKVLFYLERNNTLYEATLDDIIKYVENLYPWEEMDAYIFDNNLDWVVAITHEDQKILVLGL